MWGANQDGVKMQALRNDIKSYGKFAIFSKLKIEGGWVKRANIVKIKTKVRNFRLRESARLCKN